MVQTFHFQSSSPSGPGYTDEMRKIAGKDSQLVFLAVTDSMRIIRGIRSNVQLNFTSLATIRSLFYKQRPLEPKYLGKNILTDQPNPHSLLAEFFSNTFPDNFENEEEEKNLLPTIKNQHYNYMYSKIQCISYHMHFH